MDDNENFDRIMAGLGEVLEIAEGRAEPARVFVPADINVKAIRGRLGLSQNEFAAQYGFSAAAVRDWEQHRRRPEASARVLLTVIDKEPDAVKRALCISVGDQKPHIDVEPISTSAATHGRIIGRRKQAKAKPGATLVHA